MQLFNRLFALLIVLSITHAALSQEYKLAVSNSKDGKLTLSNFSGPFSIEGYSGNEIIITRSGGDDDEHAAPPERTKGLKPIYAAGTDNTGIGAAVEKNGNQVTIDCLLPFTKRGNYKIKVPDNLALKISSGCERSNSIELRNMKNELEINNCHDIDLKNVTGPLVLSTISGSINVTLTSVSKENPTSIASVSGDIDVSIPAGIAANLELSTISGNMYSDFDIEIPKGSMKRVGGNSIKTKLNGGGGDLKITNISGNIYLRKTK